MEFFGVVGPQYLASVQPACTSMVRGPWKKLVENWQIKTELCRAYQSATSYRAEPNGGSEFQLVLNTDQMQVWEVRRWRRTAGLPRKGWSLQLQLPPANDTNLPLSAVSSEMQRRGLKYWFHGSGKPGLHPAARTLCNNK
jgi:hypothetical protein